MQRPHWDYYLTLVEDLESLSRYIDFSEANAQTYSIELVRLLLSIGSEVDVVCKVVCSLSSTEKKAKNIDQYRKVLIAQYPQLPNIAVSAPKHSLCFRPWESWNNSINPVWWSAYNNVKHERDSFYNQATLWNVLKAASGLCVVVGYLHRDWLEESAIRRPFLFFDSEYNAEPVFQIKPRLKLP